jgi:predicted DNA-binding transcriptional regulator YafY
MNRTDRLLAIVLELQGKGRQRAEDLAATFETSKRTIYRDIQALGEAGVPLISVPGRGYSLMKGYFLPPLSFTTDEATMLLLGSDFTAQNFDAQYRSAAQSASRKIESVLPEKLRDEVHHLQDSIRFISSGSIEGVTETEMVRQLRRAIIERATVRFCYHTRYVRSGQSTQQTREADPYGLVHFANAWHLVAYCHLRQDIRNFRLDRMENLELLSRVFQRPADFKMHERRQEEAGKVVVRALFDQEVTRWVRESRSYYTVAVEESAQGLLVTLQVRQESEILQWLLSWGRHVQVLEPESLKRTIAEEAAGMLRNHQRDYSVDHAGEC